MPQKVCVIGAGSAGLTTIKALKEHGIPFDCFEMGSDIGGNWRFNNDNGRSAAYETLHIDTSKDRMAFSDFPMPESYPNYPHHTQVLAYFEQYADQFGLRDHITFRTKVERVAPIPVASVGGYFVTVRNLDSDATKTVHYRAVLVCNGHHWNPHIPDFPGPFAGETLHSRAYRSNRPFAGKRVLVVGIGNSAVDIACEVALLSKQTFLSTRRSAVIIPRYLLGRPTDKWVTPLSSWLPPAVQMATFKLLLAIDVGDQARYGVYRPKHGLHQAHPTMSSELLDRVKSGHIIMKPDVRKLASDVVHFEDNSAEQIDVIIYATGYLITFPFFDPGFFEINNNQLPLYHYVVAPDHPDLYFIGFIQPLGAIMPLAELQARWVAGVLNGSLALPTKHAMRNSIARDRRTLQKRYVTSPRHTMQVDFYPYKRRIEKEIRMSRKRARNLQTNRFANKRP